MSRNSYNYLSDFNFRVIILYIIKIICRNSYNYLSDFNYEAVVEVFSRRKVAILTITFLISTRNV